MSFPFRSFFLGGFESASHCRRDGCRVDALASCFHDEKCEEDFALLASAGIFTVRDAFRWHCIEPEPGQYDWSSFDAMLHAAHRTGTQVLWDLCHWGVPGWANPFDPDFLEHFARYAECAVTRLCEFHSVHRIAEPPIVCPINEISFWAWVGGDKEHIFPHGFERGHELKRQLVAAANQAIRRVRRVCPQLLVLQPEPVIFIAPDPAVPEASHEAVGHTAAQYDAWDMLLGRRFPELGGSEDHLDVIGVNYYWNNQWVHHGVHTPPGHTQHRPLHSMLVELWERYGKPLLISETSAENDAGPGWFAYVMAEVREAERLGVPVLGVCLYPVMDYAGWDDGRHCSVGLIELSPGMRERKLRPAMLAELQVQQAIRSLR